jgi:hypothetical protein
MYQAEAAKQNALVQSLASSVYGCVQGGGDPARCQADAAKAAGVTTMSPLAQQFVGQQVPGQVAQITNQQNYFNVKTNYNLCVQQQDSGTKCSEWAAQADALQNAMGIGPTDTKALAALNAAYTSYVVQNASNLYLTAKIALDGCTAQAATNKSIDCSAYQKNASDALSYGGMTSVNDQTAMIQRSISFQKATDILNIPNSTICGSNPNCDPEQIKQQRIAALNMDPTDAKYAQDSWYANIVYNLQHGGPGIELTIGKLLASNPTQCKDYASCQAAIKDALPTDQLALVSKNLDQLAAAEANASGDAAALAYAQIHKNDPMFKGVDTTNATEVHAAMDGALPSDLQRSKLVAQSPGGASGPSSQSSVPVDNAVSQAYQKYRDDLMLDAGTRSQLGTTAPNSDPLQTNPSLLPRYILRIVRSRSEPTPARIGISHTPPGMYLLHLPDPWPTQDSRDH